MTDSDRSLTDSLTEFFKEYNNLYVIVLFGYGLVVFPWLRAEGFYDLGLVIAVVLLVGLVFALRANVERARERLGGNDEEFERRGF
ncbi:hypothetical protein [Haloarchaeobius iranensis]|uniref:Uncharacterized protein n=1 Tax=Haloarchaeobius iranensis TaxID=996166 RepID=A0A1G9TP40_9EURY|nr:hypothetical protein [Haloarchaeobius iranensis]SDM49559.1 hypothetical protein SAMN05192554_10346 [Haloarchaeobius iranensis]